MPLTYVITGTSRGLGLEFVKQISAQDHTVFALARNPETSEGLKAFVDNKRVFAVKHDADSMESANEAAEEVKKHAPEGIDVLINNADITNTIELIPENTPKDDFIRVVETNIIGASNVIQAFLPLLRKRGPDAIKKFFNISTILGSINMAGIVNPTSNYAAYAVSKAALNMLTKLNASALAKENFIITSVHLGWFEQMRVARMLHYHPKSLLLVC